MKIIALIDSPEAIRRILEHLKQWEPLGERPRPRGPPEQAQEALSFPGDPSQDTFAFAQAPLEAIDEIPPEEFPSIIYD